MGKQTFFRQVRCISRLKLWKIMVIFRRWSRSSFSERAVMSFPSTKTAPEVGRSSRFMHRTRVDFPAPERPMIPKISPCRMSRQMSSRAWTGSAPPPKVLLKC